MVQIVVVNKTGECINTNLTTMVELYKKCGFKKKYYLLERDAP